MKNKGKLEMLTIPNSKSIFLFVEVIVCKRNKTILKTQEHFFQ